MLTPRSLIVAGVATASIGQLASAALIIRDSADFVNQGGSGSTASYEAASIPQNAAPVWTSPGNAQTYGAVDGELTLTTEVSNNRFFHTGAFWSDDVTRATGYTVEFRMRVDAITDNSRGPVLFRIADGAQQVELEWRSNAIVWNGTALQLDPSEYRTYRIVYDPQANAGAGAYAAWIDETLISNTLSGAASSGNQLAFGDTSATRYGGTTTWDYIRWDTTGAYAPIPEPASLALLTLGGMMFLRRR